MGKRGRARGERGKGAAQARKERRLGIDASGLSKTMLDAMNEEALQRFHVGIGVCVQEEQRAREVVDSLMEEYDAIPAWKLAERMRLGRIADQHRREAALWGDRIEQCGRAVAERASDADVARARTAR
jgi:hypothetical protein